MDQVIRVWPGIGEIGLDTEASPGNGPYYLKMYDGSFDECGYESVEDATYEFEYIVDSLENENELSPVHYDNSPHTWEDTVRMWTTGDDE